jgi:hemerythrin
MVIQIFLPLGVGAVRENMIGIIKENEKKKGKNWFSRFFA